MNCGVGEDLRVPWIARRSNQSILKGVSPEYSLEGLMLKLKLQYFGLLMWRTHWKRPWCWERLKAGGERDNRGWDGWMASLTWWTWVWVSSRNWWWTRRPGMLQSMESQSQTRLSNWTELNWDINQVSTLSLWYQLLEMCWYFLYAPVQDQILYMLHVCKKFKSLLMCWK